MFEESSLHLLKKIFFWKNYLANLTISFIFSIKHAWKLEKKVLGAVILSVFSANLKILAISQRRCTMRKENGSYNEKSS